MRSDRLLDEALPGVIFSLVERDGDPQPLMPLDHAHQVPRTLFLLAV
jgi:hypothetical protein